MSNIEKQNIARGNRKARNTLEEHLRLVGCGRQEQEESRPRDLLTEFKKSPCFVLTSFKPLTYPEMVGLRAFWDFHLLVNGLSDERITIVIDETL